MFIGQVCRAVVLNWWVETLSESVVENVGKTMQDANNKMPLSCYVVVVVEGCVSSKAHDILDNLVTGNMANTSRKKVLNLNVGSM